MEFGDEIGPRQRAGPGREEVARYIAAAEINEPLFSDPALARALGYAGPVVPGPLLTAYLEQFVRTELPAWRLDALSATFRVATTAGEPLVFRGVIVERHADSDGEHLTCDLVIEHGSGERAVTGTARLTRHP